jgi:hypothetical protein
MDIFNDLESQGLNPTEIMEAAEVFASITQASEKAFKLRPKHVTAGRARQQIRTEIDLWGYGTAALVLRGSADPKDLAQAELIERFCMLNPDLKDAAAAFFQRYIHDAGAQRPMDHLMTLCGFTDEAKPKPSGRSSL